VRALGVDPSLRLISKSFVIEKQEKDGKDGARR
jgi:hypothetical protein